MWKEKAAQGGQGGPLWGGDSGWQLSEEEEPLASKAKEEGCPQGERMEASAARENTAALEACGVVRQEPKVPEDGGRGPRESPGCRSVWVVWGIPSRKQHDLPHFFFFF